MKFRNVFLILIFILLCQQFVNGQDTGTVNRIFYIGVELGFTGYLIDENSIINYFSDTNSIYSSYDIGISFGFFLSNYFCLSFGYCDKSFVLLKNIYDLDIHNINIGFVFYPWIVELNIGFQIGYYFYHLIDYSSGFENEYNIDEGYIISLYFSYFFDKSLRTFNVCVRNEYQLQFLQNGNYILSVSLYTVFSLIA